MTDAPFRVVVPLVRAWTWVYTTAIDGEECDRRRREIESDLWEFEAESAASWRRAAHMLIRTILGVPDDLLWMCGRLASRAHPLALSTIVRTAVIAIALATVVVSAKGPMLDPVRTLKVNVDAAGWVRDRADPDGSGAFAPAIAFTLTNVGEQATAALDVNAVFHRADDEGGMLGMGAAFAPIVGWRGLRAGATTPRVLLRGPAMYQIDGRSARHVAIPLQQIDEAHVRLFAHHEGRWTLLGDFRVPVRPIAR